MHQRTTVLIADDHELFRESLAALLAREPGIEVAGTAGDGRSAIVMAKSRQPRVAILGTTLAGIGSVQVANQMRVDSPHTGLVLLAGNGQADQLKEFMRGDSAGKAFLLKSTLRSTRDILRTIDDVSAGRTVLDPAMVSKLTSDDTVRVAGALKNLSPRELQVLHLMSRALSNRAVAETLFIQPRTVEHHISSILAKLGFNSDGARHGRSFAILTYFEATGQMPAQATEAEVPQPAASRLMAA
jgi:DNA-binding NarL/FixJ family response regulator